MYRNKIYLVIVLLVIALGVLIFTKSPFMGDIFQLPLFTEVDQKDSSFLKDVTGKIHLTLQPIDRSLPQGLYFYDFESGLLERPSYKEGATLVTSKNSPNKENEFAFVARDLDGDSQVFTADLSSYGVKQITSSDTELKLLPEWSPDGNMIAFSVGGTRPGADSSVPEDWKVYITDLDGREFFISNGIYPKWSPNGGYVLFMKNDGLYVHDINRREGGNKVWNTDDGLMYTGMKLDVSPDGKMIALSNVDKGKVVLIEVLSWYPFGLEMKEEISSYSFWPTFSSDSSYLAIQEVDGLNLLNPRLVVYDLDTLEREVVLNLRGYIQEAMFISDWQE